jgi:hypothetical protein
MSAQEWTLAEASNDPICRSRSPSSPQEERNEVMARQLSQRLLQEEYNHNHNAPSSDSDLCMAQQLQDKELARRFSRIEELQATTSTFLDEHRSSTNNININTRDEDEATMNACRIAREMEDAKGGPNQNRPNNRPGNNRYRNLRSVSSRILQKDTNNEPHARRRTKSTDCLL